VEGRHGLRLARRPRRVDALHAAAAHEARSSTRRHLPLRPGRPSSQVFLHLRFGSPKAARVRIRPLPRWIYASLGRIYLDARFLRLGDMEPLYPFQRRWRGLLYRRSLARRCWPAARQTGVTSMPRSHARRRWPAGRDPGARSLPGDASLPTSFIRRKEENGASQEGDYFKIDVRTLAPFTYHN